ncbi:Ribonuclease 3-like protein 3 [Cardamine amara subsp. amara]|uniref:Ribonuclease 3-like protein 3 n=1 Tax=Cardamine amara subsp. amara TaxID=228776 RepID=A0ABD1C147_CARAN
MNLVSFEGKDNTKINGSGPLTSAEPVQPLDIECVEKILNYKFKNKSLLVQAFTDPSYDEKCVSYERLEFLGDTILSMVITNEFYNLYPKESPGSLTNLRAANVDTEKLARVAVKHNLHRYLRHKKPLFDDQVLEFVKAVKKDPTLPHSHGLLTVPKFLADIVESTIGALFMDCNSTDTVWKVVKPLLEPIIHLDKLEKHPMTELNEKCQKKKLTLTTKDTWEETKNFFFFIEDKMVGHGYHPVKKETAKYLAAKNAIDTFFGDL